MTNHQYNTMESQILKKNQIITAWRFYNGRREPLVVSTASSSVSTEHSLHSPRSLKLQIIGTLIDTLYNVITNTWAPDISKTNLPSEDIIFNKLKLHGHLIKSGDSVAVAHSEDSNIPWFAKIVCFIWFISFDQVIFILYNNS